LRKYETVISIAIVTVLLVSIGYHAHRELILVLTSCASTS